ncbi:GNAT family N-acetyltransferase [Ferrovibrio sp.]|uniref:GNAT family N-acetyltransferase n=1 Tax=Ferrovibrio sp. TaxID=1917215 RepID=UPI001B6CDD79|nr:GNAT family N-acetyltransferase [Ferrovibrio sp.]MBP7066635.1 GNAT family N-acetyltransferase [Ferrovibrio sp.]
MTDSIARPIFSLPAATRRADGRFDVVVVYLDMTTPPPETPNPAPLLNTKLALLKLDQPSVSYYRYLYGSVGRPWHWVERHRLSDTELAEIIHDKEVEIFVPYVGGVPAGYVEFDRRETAVNEPGGTNIAYFGLMPESIGRGLGRWFLRWAVQYAFSKGIPRLTVNTCNLDHPSALPLYQKVGFRPYQSRQAVFDPTI